MNISKGDMITILGLFFSVMSGIVFSIVASLFYKIYTFSGYLSVPGQAVIFANLLAILGVSTSLYGIVKKGSKKLGIAGIIVGLLVTALPYILLFF